MLNNFIYAKTKALFEEQLNKGNILDEAIVFIEDTKEIWNHGTYFGHNSDFEYLEDKLQKQESLLNVLANYNIEKPEGDHSVSLENIPSLVRLTGVCLEGNDYSVTVKQGETVDIENKGWASVNLTGNVLTFTETGGILGECDIWITEYDTPILDMYAREPKPTSIFIGNDTEEHWRNIQLAYESGIACGPARFSTDKFDIKGTYLCVTPWNNGESSSDDWMVTMIGHDNYSAVMEMPDSIFQFNIYEGGENVGNITQIPLSNVKTQFKTINGESIVGTGDIVIEGGADWNAQEGETGYIENRPFGKLKVNGEIFDVSQNPLIRNIHYFIPYDKSIIEFEPSKKIDYIRVYWVDNDVVFIDETIKIPNDITSVQTIKCVSMTSLGDFNLDFEKADNEIRVYLTSQSETFSVMAESALNAISVEAITYLSDEYLPDTIARKSDIPVPIIINYNTIKDAANSEVNTISEQTWLKYIANDTYKNYDWIIQRDGIKYNCTVIPDYDNRHIQILYFTRNEIEGTSGPLGNAIMKYSGLRIQLLPYTENTYLIYKISNGGSLETREFVFGEDYNKNAYLIAAAQMSGIDTIDCKWVYTTKANETITVNGQYFHIENSITNVDAIFSVKDKSLTYVDGNGLINKVTFADNGSYDISKNNPDWNAQEGEAGYINNRPCYANLDNGRRITLDNADITLSSDNNWYEKIIIPINEYHQISLYFYDINGNLTNYVLTEGQSVFDSHFGCKFTAVLNESDSCDLLLTDFGDPKEYVDTIFAETKLVYEYNNTIMQKLDSMYLPDTIIKTTPQYLSNTDKNQALANLGIDPVVWKYMMNPFIIENRVIVPDYLVQLLINDNPLILNLCKIKIEVPLYDEGAGANRTMVHFCTPIAYKWNDDSGLLLQCITFYNNAYHTYYAEVDIFGSGEVYEIYEITES